MLEKHVAHTFKYVEELYEHIYTGLNNETDYKYHLPEVNLYMHI